MQAVLLAGAAAVDVQQLGVDLLARRSEGLPPAPWPQQLRCLALSQGAAHVLILNGDWGIWPTFLDETQQIAAEVMGEPPAALLYFATQANHNLDFDGVDWFALDPRHHRHDPRQREELTAAIRMVVQMAWVARRPARLSVGERPCPGIAVNCYTGRAATNETLRLVRVDAQDGSLLAALLQFPCRSHDTVRALSAGLAGATAATVRKVYGDVPVFHFNGGSGDAFLATRSPGHPEGAGAEAYYAAWPATLTREYERIGRVIGGAAIALLAELEAAGEPLLTQNERWRPTSWRRYAPGYRLSQARLSSMSVPVRLWPVSLPDVDTCVARVKDLDREQRRLLRRFEGTPRGSAPFPLDPDDTTSPLAQLMAVGAKRAYWGIAAGRAKVEARRGRSAEQHGIVQLLVLDENTVIVGVPACLCGSTAAAIRAASPFSTTLVWDCLAPWSLGQLIPPAEGSLGGAHRAFQDVVQEALDEMLRDITTALSALRQAVTDSEQEG